MTLNEAGIGACDFVWKDCICSLFPAQKILGSTIILIIYQKLSLIAKFIYIWQLLSKCCLFSSLSLV